LSGTQTEVDFALDNGTVGSEFQAGDLFHIRAEDPFIYWKLGDVIELSSNLGVCTVKIVQTFSGTGAPTFNIFLVEFLDFKGSYIAPQQPTVWTGNLYTKEKL